MSNSCMVHMIVLLNHATFIKNSCLYETIAYVELTFETIVFLGTLENNTLKVKSYRKRMRRSEDINAMCLTITTMPKDICPNVKWKRNIHRSSGVLSPSSQSEWTIRVVAASLLDTPFHHLVAIQFSSAPPFPLIAFVVNTFTF